MNTKTVKQFTPAALKTSAKKFIHKVLLPSGINNWTPATAQDIAYDDMSDIKVCGNGGKLPKNPDGYIKAVAHHQRPHFARALDEILGEQLDKGEFKTDNAFIIKWKPATLPDDQKIKPNDLGLEGVYYDIEIIMKSDVQKKLAAKLVQQTRSLTPNRSSQNLR